MKKWTTLAMTAVALTGCLQDGHAPHPHGEEDVTTQESVPSNLVKEFSVSENSHVRFQEYGGEVTLSLQGPIEEREANADLEARLFSTATMEAAYRLLDSKGPVPQVLLDYDARLASSSLPQSREAPDAIAETGASSVLPPVDHLHKSSSHANPAGDANWDWTADANWWKGDVVGYECSWHEAAHYTNVTWADDWRGGWKSRGYLMAASHTYGAYAYAYVWSNGAWSQTNGPTYLQPRHYIVWSTGDQSFKYRRFRVVGNGGAYARIHWGMRWDSQAPSDIGVICQE